MTTWKASHAPEFRMGNPWRPKVNKGPDDALTLSQVVVLRRLSEGLSQTQVAQVLGWPRGTVTGMVRTLRIRFGVTSTADLLVHSNIAERLKSDGAA